jgi:hypothetical protein
MGVGTPRRASAAVVKSTMRFGLPGIRVSHPQKVL